VLQAGHRCGPRRSAAAVIEEARHRFLTDIVELPDALCAIHNPEQLHPATSYRFRALSEHVRHRLDVDELGDQRAPGAHR
jgi:hypothetical protein